MDITADMGFPMETTALWGPLIGWLIGMLLYQYWEVSKWIRDQKREGHDVGLKSYFENYQFLTWIMLGLAISLFWAWRAGISFALFGFEVEIPFVPALSWFMGFGAIGFAQHAVKIMRNFLNRMKGEAL